MEYQRFGNTIYARLDRGEDILEDLKKLSLKENIRLASVVGLGAVDDMTVGVFDVETRKYHALHYTGVREITSLVGSINTMNGEYYAHIHMSAADVTGAVVGGHLSAGRIGVTAELTITVTDGTVDRVYDGAVTGVNLYAFSEGTVL